MKNKKGMTIIELIIVIILVAMVLGLAGTFVNFSFFSQKKSADEYKIQADLRLASDTINNQIRNASVAFTIPQQKFDQAGEPINKKWSYLGIEDHKYIVQYTSINDVQTKKILFTADKGLSYSLNFVKSKDNTKLIEYTLEASLDTNTNSKITINSKIEALNSVAVDEGGSVDTQAVAIAYKTEPIPIAERTTVAIALVLDDSGSMSYDMNGKHNDEYGFNSSLIRKVILKQKAEQLINAFSTMGNVNVSVIPFANNADSYSNWIDSTTNKGDIIDAINGIVGNGGTNTGDGMRRAYYRLVAFDSDISNNNKKILNYMILLTDGNPTYYSSNASNYDPQINSQNANHVLGSGQQTDSTNVDKSMAYVDFIGRNLIVGQDIDIKTFTIGFTAITSEVNRVKSIAEQSCTKAGDTNRVGAYYPATNAQDLENVFRSIKNYILSEQWHIQGPY